MNEATPNSEAPKSEAPKTEKPKQAGEASPSPASRRGTISVTPAAVEAIRRQIAKRNRPETSLRVGIRGGGCSGFSYVVEFHDGPPRPKDVVFDYGDVRVVVDPKSLLYLNGSTLDWEQLLVRQGFKFINPNEKASCGCGHSFTV